MKLAENQKEEIELRTEEDDFNNSEQKRLEAIRKPLKNKLYSLFLIFIKCPIHNRAWKKPIRKFFHAIN